MAHDDPIGFQGYRINVGLSSIIGITAGTYQCAITIKHFGGATLEIGGPTLSWGIGYVMSSLETKDIDSRGTFYMCSAGATAVVHVFRAGTNTDFGT